MNSLNAIISNASILSAWVFVPQRYRVLRSFRNLDMPYYLVVVLGNAERKIALPCWRGVEDENLKQILGYLNIDVSPDLMANRTNRILYSIARRINAKITTLKGWLQLSNFTLIVNWDGTDDSVGHRPQIDIRPSNTAGPAQISPDAGITLLDDYPDFDLVFRADGSQVHHRNHWPMLLKSQSSNSHRVLGGGGLGISLKYYQGIGPVIEQSKLGELDDEILSMDEEERNVIAREAYVKVLKGWDVAKLGDIPPLGRILYDKDDLAKTMLNRKEVLL